MALEFIKLDLTKEVSSEELLDAINKNNATSIAMRKEMLPIINSNSKNKKTTFTTVKEEKIVSDRESINQDFEDEIDYYLNLVNSIGNAKNFAEELYTILPSKDNCNYENIILRINAELLKSIKEIEELIEEEKDNLTQDDLLEFRNEIVELSNKMDAISKHNTDKESSITVENNLIFVPTYAGNIRVLDELSHIDSQYYDGFIGLFDSIKDGSFKNVKRFSTTNNKTSGVAEVKDFKIRVVFDRIGKNDYAIITSFIKKTNVDKNYFETLELKIRSYLNQKDSIIDKLQTDEFREENKEYEKELYGMLTSPKTTAKVKQMKEVK